MQDTPPKSLVPTRLLWIDLEMTGLDPGKDAIVEYAAIVTDFALNEIASKHGIIHQPDDVLAASNSFSLEAHEKSGLYVEVRKSTLDLKMAEADLIQFVQKHIPDEPVVLAGNSIHSDRKFIDAHMKDFAALLHYRMLDVSSFKVWWRGRGGGEYVKKESHRALDDIRESMAELQYYSTKGIKQ